MFVKMCVDCHKFWLFKTEICKDCGGELVPVKVGEDEDERG